VAFCGLKMSDARRQTFFVLLSAALVLLAFTPIRRLATLSLNLGNNHLSYIPLVPFLSAALIYWNRKKIFSKLRTSALPAATAFMISAVLYYASRTIGTRLDENDHLSLTIAALVAAWLGTFLLMYGSVAFKSGLFRLLFVGLIIPVPSRIMNAIVHFLQNVSNAFHDRQFASGRWRSVYAAPSVPAVSVFILLLRSEAQNVDSGVPL